MLHHVEVHVIFLHVAYVLNAFKLFRVCARFWKLDKKEYRKGKKKTRKTETAPLPLFQPTILGPPAARGPCGSPSAASAASARGPSVVARGSPAQPAQST
jgi:nitroreductase